MPRTLPTTRYVTVESARDLDRLVERSRRTSGLRLPAAFARGAARSDETSPLARLVQGGRGGELRLKLYLCMALLAGSTRTKGGKAHTIDDVSGPTWARVLALSDPQAKGARRIADAQNQLERLGLIDVQRLAGHIPIVTLKHAGGTGEPFSEPGTPYIRIPLGLWTHGWLWSLNGTELAVLVALLDLCYGDGRSGTPGPQPLSAVDPTRYGLSDNSWRLASATLTESGLLATDHDVVRMDLESPRKRKLYEVKLEGLDDTPDPNLLPTA